MPRSITINVQPDGTMTTDSILCAVCAQPVDIFSKECVSTWGGPQHTGCYRRNQELHDKLALVVARMNEQPLEVQAQ